MIQKRVLSPNRVRRLPKCDWSWVDRRFLREFASKLSGDAVFLYYILVAVSDKNGLSYYSDNALALMVRTSLPSLLSARQELIDYDLLAYEAPLVQVLSLPVSVQAQATVSSNDQATQTADAANLQRLIAALAQSASVTRREA
jgi:hypothetical protein